MKSKPFILNCLAPHNTRSDPHLTSQNLSTSSDYLKWFSHTGLPLSLKHTELTSAIDPGTIFSVRYASHGWLILSFSLNLAFSLSFPWTLNMKESSIHSYSTTYFYLQPLLSPVIYLFSYYLSSLYSMG